MPTYNYKCSKCGEVFDIEATLQEKEEGGEKFICPKCGAKEITQNFSAVNIMKNVLAADDVGVCCSGGNACDIRCKPDANNSDGCGDKKEDGCCG